MFPSENRTFQRFLDASSVRIAHRFVPGTLLEGVRLKHNDSICTTYKVIRYLLNEKCLASTFTSTCNQPVELSFLLFRVQ
jgi:hypothetical protein